MKRRDFFGSPMMIGLASQRAAPPAKRRVILYDDGTQLLMSGDGRMQREDVVRWVKALAGTHVDTISWSVALPDICFYDTRAGERFGKDRPQYEPWEWLISRNLESLIRGGNDPLRVICEAGHSIGLRVMAAIRMNDEHQSGGLQGGFLASHPEWRIGKSVALDYGIPEVREHRFAVIREIVDRFDVDGLELDWMRWMKIVSPGQAPTQSPVLTDWIGGIRRMLAEQSKRRHKKLSLGVRVAPTLRQTLDMGIDLPVWISRRLVDYVVPSEFIYNNFNLAAGEYAGLTRGSSSRLYPALHPYLDNHAGNTDFRQMTVEHYRALAHSYYSQGADGVSTYNLFPQQLAFAPGYSESELFERYLAEQAKAIREIGEPATVSSHRRTYAFYKPLELKPGERQAMAVRIPEKSGVLRFKATNMTYVDEIELDAGGGRVPAASIKRTHYMRRMYGFEPSLPPFYLHEATLELRPDGEHNVSIGFRVTKKNAEIKDPIVIRELEFEAS